MKSSEFAPTTEVNNGLGSPMPEIEQVLDPRYTYMICFSCGDTGHYVGNILNIIFFFISQ